MLKNKGDMSGAMKNAGMAIAGARKGHSGFRYHQIVGLLGKQYDEIQFELVRLARRGGAPCVLQDRESP